VIPSPTYPGICFTLPLVAHSHGFFFRLFAFPKRQPSLALILKHAYATMLTYGPPPPPPL